MAIIPPKLGSFLGKVGGGAKIAGGVAGGVVGAGAVKAGAAAQVGGALAWQGVSRVWDSIDDPGFILFIAGVITFFFVEYLGNPILALLLGSIFLFYSSLFIFKAKGIVVVSIFWVWYIFLGGTFNIELILYQLLPLFFFGMILRGIFSKVENGNFSEGFVNEMIFGLIPIAFFFLDLGLIEFATQEVGLTLSGLGGTLRYFLLFTPWWALLGLFKTEKKNGVINFIRAIAVGYIFILLLFGIVPDTYATLSASAPGPAELLAAKNEYQQRQVGVENPVWSTGRCLLENRFTDLEQCKKEKQEESELRALCKDAPDVDQCIERERKRRAQMAAAGTQDQEIQAFTKAEIKINDKTFPKQVIRREGEPFVQRYVAQLHLENPHGQTLGVRGSCVFKKGGVSIPGTLSLPGGDSRAEISGKVADVALVCTPSEEKLDEFKGPMTIRYTATLEGLKTTSILKRAFLPNGLDVEAKNSRVEQVMKLEFPSAQDILSRAPQEFARINYGFGYTEAQPIIAESTLIFVSSIENVGTGKINRIQSYKFDLMNKGFIEDSGDCFTGSGENLLLGTERLQPLSSCFVSVPYEYNAFTEPYLVDTFSAELVYDYNITKDMAITVNVIRSDNGVPVADNGVRGVGVS